MSIASIKLYMYGLILCNTVCVYTHILLVYGKLMVPACLLCGGSTVAMCPCRAVRYIGVVMVGMWTHTYVVIESHMPWVFLGHPALPGVCVCVCVCVLSVLKPTHMGGRPAICACWVDYTQAHVVQ